jgi:hypothetical protein
MTFSSLWDSTSKLPALVTVKLPVVGTPAFTSSSYPSPPMWAWISSSRSDVTSRLTCCPTRTFSFWPLGVTFPPDSKMVRRRASPGGLSVLDGAAFPERLADGALPPELLPDRVAPAEPPPDGAALVALLPEGAALVALLPDGAALAELLVAPVGAAAGESGALVQAPRSRQSAEVIVAAAALRCWRPLSFVGVGVLFVVPLVLTCLLTPPSAVLDPTVRAAAVAAPTKRRTLR